MIKGLTDDGRLVADHEETIQCGPGVGEIRELKVSSLDGFYKLARQLAIDLYNKEKIAPVTVFFVTANGEKLGDAWWEDCDGVSGFVFDYAKEWRNRPDCLSQTAFILIEAELPPKHFDQCLIVYRVATSY